MSVLGDLHGRHVHPRRVRVLTEQLAPLIPPAARVLDIGCGDGLLGAALGRYRPDIAISGADVLVRARTHLPVRQVDGKRLPFADDDFDVVLFIDVLHHVDDPLAALTEARRIAPVIIVKDHFRQGLAAHARLRVMDWVGNARHGVPLTYEYWSPQQWRDAFATLQLTAVDLRNKLGLYPPPASWLFDRSLHFIAKLVRRVW